MAQLYSGGIIIATGFKTDAPQLIDDRCAVDLDSDLDNIPNKCKGLHAYSDENGGSLHYYNGTEWIKVATGGDLSSMDLQTVLDNGNTTTTPIWFPYDENSTGFKWSIYSSPANNPNLPKGGQYIARVQNDGYLSLYNNLLDRNGAVSTNTYFGFQSLYSLPKSAIDNTDPVVKGRNNTAFGYQPLKYMTSGYGNTAFGFAPLRGMLDGADNTAIGEGAAGSVPYVDESVIVGATAASNSSYLQDAIIIGRGAAQETDTINKSTLIGNFQYNVELSENEIILADGRITGGTNMSGVGFWVKKDGLTTLNRQTQSQYDLDGTGKAAVTKEILENELTEFGGDYIPLSQKGANNGVATLDGGGKVPATQLPNSVMTLEGEWNASTNTPTLADGVGNPGMIYEVTTGGTVDLGSGNITFANGDYVVYGSSGVWYKSVNSNEVTSVNGQTGVVNLEIDDLSDVSSYSGANQFAVTNSSGDGVIWTEIKGSYMGITSGVRIPTWNAVAEGWGGGLAYSSNATAGNDVVLRNSGRLVGADAINNNDAVMLGQANSLFQPLDADLTSIAGLSGTSGLLRKTAANTWNLDTNVYATQSYVDSNLTLQGVLTNGTQYSWGGAANEKLSINSVGFKFGIGPTYNHVWVGNIDDGLGFRPGIQIAGTLFSSTPHIHRIVNDGTSGGGVFEHILPKKNGTFAHIEDVLANSDVSLTEPRKIDTNGNPFTIEELPDKRMDATFDKFLGMNSNGQLAHIGFEAFRAEAESWDDEQRKEFAQKLNGNFSNVGVSVNLISPPVFQQEDNDVYVVLRGANLNLHPTNRKIEILDASDNTVLAEVPNGQVQTYADGLQLIFYYNFNTLGVGTYKLQITNGAATYITSHNFQIVGAVTNIDLSENTFDILTSYTNTKSSANDTTVIYESETTATTAIPIFSAKSDELFEQGDDWVLEVQLEVSLNGGSSEQTRIGVGYSDTSNQLVFSQLHYLAFYRQFVSPTTYVRKVVMGGASMNIGTPHSTTVVFIKQGNIITAVSGTSVSTQTISNNSGYSLLVQAAGRPGTHSVSAQIIKAYKFN